MIRRLEEEARLPEAEREARPGELRVTMQEELAWLERLEAKIKQHFGEDAFERYKIFGKLRDEEKDDALTVAIRFHKRVVDYLVELQDRLDRREAETTRLPDG